MLGQIFKDGIENTLNSKFNLNPFIFNNFMQKNKNELLKLIDNEELLSDLIKVINFLKKEKKLPLLIIYLDLFCSKFPNNYDAVLLLAKSSLMLGMFDTAENTLKKIPTKLYTIEHLKILSNLYFKQSNFEKCIKIIENIRKQSGLDEVNVLMMLDCLLRLRRFKDIENEITNLSKVNIDECTEKLFFIKFDIAQNNFEIGLSKINEFDKNCKNLEEFNSLKILILGKFRKYDEAIQYIQNSNDLSKKYDYSLFNLYFCNGNFKSGADFLYKETKDIELDNYFLSSGLNKWENQNLDNKILIVYRNKGIVLGDQIFFYRYINFLNTNFPNTKIIFCTSERFSYLFQSDKIKIVELNKVDNLLNNPENIYFISLIGIFKKYHEKQDKLSILKFEKFLPFHQKKYDFWKNYFLKSNSKKKIGLNWKGNLKYAQDLYRSLDIHQLDEIINFTEFEFYSLNFDITENEIEYINNKTNFHIIDKKLFSSERTNAFIETIEILRNLNLVITTDTALAHLAAALKIKTIILLEFSPFWYWNTDEKNNYYDNDCLKFINQNEPGNWSSVLKKLSKHLKEQD